MKKVSIITILLTTIIVLKNIVPTPNSSISSFSVAKKLLSRYDFGRTFYCGCGYEDKFVKPYCVNVDNSRAKKIEWEHIIPAARLGEFITEYKKYDDCPSKRVCAQKHNKNYAFMHNDLYNLRPADGYINLVRSNKQYKEIEGNSKRFGCDIEFNKNSFEPADMIKGDIARVYLYYANVYRDYFVLTEEEKELYKKWDELDPLGNEECNFIRYVEKVQGNVINSKCVFNISY